MNKKIKLIIIHSIAVLSAVCVLQASPSGNLIEVRTLLSKIQGSATTGNTKEHQDILDRALEIQQRARNKGICIEQQNEIKNDLDALTKDFQALQNGQAPQNPGKNEEQERINKEDSTLRAELNKLKSEISTAENNASTAGDTVTVGKLKGLANGIASFLEKLPVPATQSTVDQLKVEKESVSTEFTKFKAEHEKFKQKPIDDLKSQLNTSLETANQLKESLSGDNAVTFNLIIETAQVSHDGLNADVLAKGKIDLKRLNIAIALVELLKKTNNEAAKNNVLSDGFINLTKSIEKDLNTLYVTSTDNELDALKKQEQEWKIAHDALLKPMSTKLIEALKVRFNEKQLDNNAKVAAGVSSERLQKVTAVESGIKTMYPNIKFIDKTASEARQSLESEGYTFIEL